MEMRDLLKYHNANDCSMILHRIHNGNMLLMLVGGLFGTPQHVFYPDCDRSIMRWNPLIQITDLQQPNNHNILFAHNSTLINKMPY